MSSDATHTFKFTIGMSCGGCSGAVERSLKNLDGVQSYSVDLGSQQAEVVVPHDSLSYADVLAKIKKTGKTVKTGEADGVVMSVE